MLTITSGFDRLAEVGREILWSGAPEISFRTQTPVRQSTICRSVTSSNPSMSFGKN
jgi:hypothetical protein